VADRALLELTASKRYGGRAVLDDARLVVRPGTVHGLVGENGAGKSTLVRIAAGLVRGEPGTIVSTSERVGLVAQHGSLVPTLTVVENAVLGREPTRGGLLALDVVAARLRALGEQHGLAVDPHARAETLSVGEQQRAELVIALDRGARLLLLDEPTAVLAPVEVDGLLAVLRRLADAGGAVVLVSHKLDEVVAIADEVTVLRAGKVVATMARPLRAPEIARAMVGGELTARPATATAPADAPVMLALRGVHVGVPVRGVDLEVRAGELVGVAGVEGNGQRELVAAIAGLAPVTAGTIELAGQAITRATVRGRQRAGLGHVAEDRHHALLLDATVEDNLALGRHRELGGFLIDRVAKRRHAERLVAALDVRPPDVTLPARALSGGNQQKLVIARELTRPDLRALVAAQPTRGVDLGASARIHAGLAAAAAAGAGVLVVSADLDELLAICHRVVVLHRGRLAGELAGAALHAADARLRLGRWMTGAEAA